MIDLPEFWLDLLPDVDDPDYIAKLYHNLPQLRPDDYYVIDLTKECYGIMGRCPADWAVSMETANVPRINAFPDPTPVAEPVKKSSSPRIVIDLTKD